MKLSKLMQKMVVNTVNGEMLGYIVDMEIDLHTYGIKCFIVQEKPSFITRILPFIFKEKSITVKVNAITSIGNDVLLVECSKIK